MLDKQKDMDIPPLPGTYRPVSPGKVKEPGTPGYAGSDGPGYLEMQVHRVFGSGALRCGWISTAP